MARINLNASRIGTLEFKNGNRTILDLGTNSNTGEAIVWQTVNNGRASRVTGKNLNRLAGDISDAIFEGDAKWLDRDDAVLNAFLRVAGWL